MSDSNHKPIHYGIDFQKQVLRLMMVDPVFCAKAAELLKPSDFAGELSWFFGAIKDSTQYSAPTKENLSADVSKHTVEKQPTYYKILDEICAIQPDSKKVCDCMTEFVRANIFIDTCYKAANQYNAGRYTEAYALVGQKILELNRVNFGNDGNVRIKAGSGELYRKAAAERANAIPTGIHRIDEAMGGGLLPGTWTTFLGASNAGKSMILPTLAKQAALKGKRTFITVHEDEEIPTQLRYVACFSGIEYTRLAFGFASLSPEELARVRLAEELLEKHVIFRFMYTAEATVEAVARQARSLMTESPFDLFLCDYGQCLMSAEFKKLDSVRHLHEHVYHMLKQLCLELKIPGAGGAQVNREGMKMARKGEDWLRVTDVSEAFGIIKKSSNVITMNRSTADQASNRIVFLLDKCRNGIVNVAVECQSDYPKCQVYSTEPLTQVDVSAVIGEGPRKQEGASGDKSQNADMAALNKRVQQQYG